MSHERWEGDAAAYALGALQRTELRQFEEHLAGCEQCQQELASMRSVVEVLPAAAPGQAPPPELKERVMAEIRAEVARQPVREPQARAPRRPIVRRARWAAPALAAAAAVALVLVLVPGGGSPTHTYGGIAYAPGAGASVRLVAGSAQLRVSRLPPPPPGRIYEVWLKRAGHRPEPTRALFVTSTGSVAVPGSLRGVQAVLVTAEPRPSGSRIPTRAPIVVVRLT